jgi:predicted nucleotidyltransferase
MVMRLKEKHKEIIKNTAKHYFGEDVKIFLFGSRVNDELRGGDIDLYLETSSNENLLDRKLKMLVELKNKLGDQKIDLIVNNFTYKKEIYSVAKNEGILL